MQEPPELPRHYESQVATDNITQPWRTTGETCPEGTVPIRRTKEEERRVESFGRKPTVWARPAVNFSNHEYSSAEVTGTLYFGAEAILNLWKPVVAKPDEFCLSQLWVVSGSYECSDLNTIEAGWQVYPYLYRDASPRLFVYWTDSYQSTSCHNLLCSGFVQVSNKIALGAALTPMSTYNGIQCEVRITIWMDQATGNWWLQVGMITMGYWPKCLFTNIGDEATYVSYGGEIINTLPSGRHTTTQMGSGHFAGEGYGKATYIRNLALVNEWNMLYPVNNATFYANAPTCYNIQWFNTSDLGLYFFFGGPGRNPKCP